MPIDARGGWGPVADPCLVSTTRPGSRRTGAPYARSIRRLATLLLLAVLVASLGCSGGQPSGDAAPAPDGNADDGGGDGAQSGGALFPDGELPDSLDTWAFVEAVGRQPAASNLTLVAAIGRAAVKDVEYKFAGFGPEVYPAGVDRASTPRGQSVAGCSAFGEQRTADFHAPEHRDQHDSLSVWGLGDGDGQFGLHDAERDRQWNGIGTLESTAGVLEDWDYEDDHVAIVITFTGEASEQRSLEKGSASAEVLCIFSTRDFIEEQFPAGRS